MATVFIPAQLRALTGGEDRIEVAGSTIRMVVYELEHLYPGIRQRLCEEDELSPSLQVSIGNTISTRGMDASVNSDSEVHFLPAIGGG